MKNLIISIVLLLAIPSFCFADFNYFKGQILVKEASGDYCKNREAGSRNVEYVFLELAGKIEGYRLGDNTVTCHLEGEKYSELRETCAYYKLDEMVNWQNFQLKGNKLSAKLNSKVGDIENYCQHQNSIIEAQKIENNNSRTLFYFAENKFKIDVMLSRLNYLIFAENEQITKNDIDFADLVFENSCQQSEGDPSKFERQIAIFAIINSKAGNENKVLSRLDEKAKFKENYKEKWLEQKVKYLKMRGIDCYKNKQYVEAIDYYQKALDTKPTKEILNGLYNISMLSGNYDKFIDYSDKIITYTFLKNDEIQDFSNSILIAFLKKSEELYSKNPQESIKILTNGLSFINKNKLLNNNKIKEEAFMNYYYYWITLNVKDNNSNFLEKYFDESKGKDGYNVFDKLKTIFYLTQAEKEEQENNLLVSNIFYEKAYNTNPNRFVAIKYARSLKKIRNPMYINLFLKHNIIEADLK